MEDNKKGCTFSVPLISTAIIVGIVFTVMKLCGAIAWDWFYVCIPFIVAGALMTLYIIILIIIVIITLIVQRM